MQDLVLCANGGRKVGKLAGLLTGLGVTAVIQSSSATTVMVVKLSVKQLGENEGAMASMLLKAMGISRSELFPGFNRHTTE